MAELNDPFERLEEKLTKVMEIIKRTRSEKRALEKEVEALKADAKERVKLFQTLEREVVSLRRDREDVRERIEKLLQRIDVLTSPDSEG